MRCFTLAVALVGTLHGSAMDRQSVSGDAPVALRAPQSAPTPARLVLDQMTATERANSRISLEFECSDDRRTALGHDVERLWNGGQYDKALAQLDDLEAHVGHVAVGNSWRKPVPTIETLLWGSDARIGNRDSLLGLSFAADPSSGNLFAVLRHGGGVSHYSICMSADTGVTWRETFTWVGSPPTGIDAVVSFDHLYVAYNSPGENARQVRARRFLCSDGSADDFPGGAMWAVACVLDTGDTMREVSLVVDGADNLLYLYTITSGGGVLPSHSFDDGQTWYQRTGIQSGASSGLDGTENKGLSSEFNFLSYVDVNDTLRICRYVYYMGSPQLCSSLLVGNGSPTSISAYSDTVICAYGDEAVSPHQVRYAISYGESDTWTTGTLSNADTSAELPAVIACGGGRFGAVYHHCGPTRELRFCQRTDTGRWNASLSVTENVPHASRPAIEDLGAGVYGVTYLSDTGPVVRGAFFDRSDWPYGFTERHTQASSHASLATVVCGMLFLPQAAGHKYHAASLLDITGRIVFDLRPGANDMRALAPGVYFVRSGPSALSRQPSAITRVVVAR